MTDTRIPAGTKPLRTPDPAKSTAKTATAPLAAPPPPPPETARRGPTDAAATGDGVQGLNERAKSIAKAGEVNEADVLAGFDMGPSTTAPAKPSFDYQYQGPPIDGPGVLDAQKWSSAEATKGLSGTDANEKINQTYQGLDKAMQGYLGDPPVSNWMTFGKFASREAGEQIRTLENAQKILSDGSAESALDAARSQLGATPIMQAVALGTKLAGDNLAKEAPLAALSPALAAASTALGLTKDGLETVEKMQTALVKGNTEIYANIAPAFDTFMQGEAKEAGGGMKALKEAGYEPGNEKDVQGFVTQAFGRYAEAGKLGNEARAPGVSDADKAGMLAKRENLIKEANVLLGCQEQMNILQQPEIFNNPVVQRTLGAISGKMEINDANGANGLRGDKPWTDFAGRMGLKEVGADQAGQPGVLPIREYKLDANGQATRELGDPKYYAFERNDKGEITPGTIGRYFEDNTSGAKADNLMAGKPRPVQQADTTNTEVGLREAARGFDKGRPDELASGLTHTAGNATQEVLNYGGGAVERHGARQVNQGVQDYMKSKGFMDRSLATARVVEGAVAQKTGEVMKRTGDTARLVADVAAPVVKSAVHSTNQYLLDHTPNWMHIPPVSTWW